MTTTDSPALSIAKVNPADLGVLDQVRGDATPDAELIASVKRRGILQPPTVAVDPSTGGYVILIGHRRVGAAIAAGLTEITVLVREGDVDVDDGEAVKLETQIVENERRKGLSAAELAQGYKRLELFGKTPADIAAELGEKPERIRAGLKITNSKAAAQLVADEPSIDFEQAAIIAEFDDHPKLQRKLIDTATTNPANFARDVESSRTQREVDARVAKLKAQLDADGVPLADVQSYGASWWSGKGVSGGPGRSLERLSIPVEAHVECPGHAAVIHKASSTYLHEQPTDWVLYVCTDWQANDHILDDADRRSPEQIERDAQLDRERAERAARQEIVNANTRARRTWIHGHLTTGRLRPTATHFDVMAAALSIQFEDHQPAPSNIILELLTGESVERRHWHQTNSNDSQLTELLRTPGTPSLRLIIANAIATFEGQLPAAAAVEYFTALASWGYALTDTDNEHLTAARAAAEELAAELAGDDLHGEPREDDDEDLEDED